MTLQENVTGLQHLGIPTNDIEATIAFFTGLGFTVEMRTVNEAAGEQVAFLRLKNVVIETYQTGSASMRLGAVDHICLDVQDVEAAFARVKEGGYTLLNQEIQFLPFWEHGVRFFTIQGPNHEKVEFCQRLAS
jgi:catechol 2,3-dioxygenase-like lactoylglutathione lyase family enzyme